MALRVEQRHLERDDAAIRIHVVWNCTRHGGQVATRGHQVAALRRKLFHLCEGTRNDDLKALRGAPCLDAALVHLRIRKSELNRRLTQECGFLLVGIVEREAPLPARDGERDSRQTSTRTDIGEILACRHRQMRQHG